MKKNWLISRVLKPVLAATLYREGSVRTIVWGPCRGLRYRIFPAYGLSPLYGGWERDMQRAMCLYLCPGAVAYDIGANFGIHTLLMAHLIGHTGHVYAFEPLPLIRQWLQDNVTMNSFSNVTCLDIAVSDQNGYSAFHTGHHSGAGHLVTEISASKQVTTVSTATIDTLVSGGYLKPPAFIKIDVEGAESKVLSGAMQTIKTFHPILLVELHNPEQDSAVGQILLHANYVAYRIKDGHRILDLTRGWPHKDGLWGQFVAWYDGDK